MRPGWMLKSYPKEPTILGGIAIVSLLLIVYTGCYTVASLLGSLLQYLTHDNISENVIWLWSVAFMLVFFGVHCEITRVKDNDKQGLFSIALGIALFVLTLGWAMYTVLGH